MLSQLITFIEKVDETSEQRPCPDSQTFIRTPIESSSEPATKSFVTDTSKAPISQAELQTPKRNSNSRLAEERSILHTSPNEFLLRCEFLEKKVVSLQHTIELHEEENTRKDRTLAAVRHRLVEKGQWSMIEEDEQLAVLREEQHESKAMRQVELVLRYNAETIDTLQSSNVALRAKLAEEDTLHQDRIKKLSDEVTGLTFDTFKMSEITADNERKRAEITRQIKRVTALQQLHDDTSSLCNLLKDQVAVLHETIAARDRQGDSQRHVTIQLRELSDTKVIQSIERKWWWGKGVKRAAVVADVAAVQVGRLLRNHAILRLFVGFYLIVLHVYVFHVVSSVLHSIPHVGDDVHDHIAGHLKR